VKADLEEHIGKGANDTRFPLTPQRVVSDLRYGSFSMSLGTLHETWNLMLKIGSASVVMEASWLHSAVFQSSVS
jgi:hypothetical protein